MTTVITFGTFDVFHVGHLKILQRSKKEGEKLIVGVSSDELNFKKKQRYPIYNQDSRMKIIAALACVDDVFLEESLELKPQYIQEHGATLLCMGDDWSGKFDDMPCNVKYFARTPSVSTTQIIETIQNL
jgi:glycerol-3-phosphate cytidylyltransferase